MKNFKKYLPQTLVMVVQALVIWAVAILTDKKDLASVEMLFIWFVIVVMGYGIIEAATPKETE